MRVLILGKVEKEVSTNLIEFKDYDIQIAEFNIPVYCI